MTPVPDPAALDSWRGRPGHWWLFKHSRACPVSAAAHAEVAAYEKAHPGDPVALVVVQDHRATSDHAAASLGVAHETPQVLLLKDGRVLWHASHGEVTQAAMELQRLPGL